MGTFQYVYFFFHLILNPSFTWILCLLSCDCLSTLQLCLVYNGDWIPVHWHWHVIQRNKEHLNNNKSTNRGSHPPLIMLLGDPMQTPPIRPTVRYLANCASDHQEMKKKERYLPLDRHVNSVYSSTPSLGVPGLINVSRMRQLCCSACPLSAITTTTQCNCVYSVRVNGKRWR